MQKGQEQFAVIKQGQDQVAVIQIGQNQFAVMRKGQDLFAVMQQGQDKFAVMKKGQDQVAVINRLLNWIPLCCCLNNVKQFSKMKDGNVERERKRDEVRHRNMERTPKPRVR